MDRMNPKIERAAKLIYDAMPYEGKYPSEKPSWVPHGNSVMQDLARRTAIAVLEPAHIEDDADELRDAMERSGR